MDKYIFDKSNGLWYKRRGNYYLPDCPCRSGKPVGIGGQRYRRYLREHRSATYSAMWLKGTLDDHVAESDREGKEMLDRLTKQIAERKGRHRAAQGQQSDGVGRSDEQHPGKGSGNCIYGVALLLM